MRATGSEDREACGDNACEGAAVGGSGQWAAGGKRGWAGKIDGKRWESSCGDGRRAAAARAGGSGGDGQGRQQGLEARAGGGRRKAGLAGSIPSPFPTTPLPEVAAPCRRGRWRGSSAASGKVTEKGFHKVSTIWPTKLDKVVNKTRFGNGLRPKVFCEVFCEIWFRIL